ncbi:Actin-related protein 6 [Conoideocrella luteorostrata]|uniref:Actin-related protein 6 n=1 Tax=Conoideocrella luteorostrata TaxID=1105319 RepID=A0AAJ0FUE8_9HYPO|nr:Actin-related protein 6 [Conoideocrella luteorostrata]
MITYAQLSVLLLSLAGPASAALNCLPEGSVVPKPSLLRSSILKSAGTNLTRTLDDAIKGTIKAGWAVENTSFSLAVVSLDQKDPGVPIWEYHHRAEKNTNGTKKVTRDSQYLIGSVSKLISDYILLQSGVDLDRAVTDFLPELNSTRSKVQWRDVTLRMLGSQLSGGPTNGGFSEYYFLKDLFVKYGFPPLQDADYPSCGVMGLNKGCSPGQVLDDMVNQYPVTAPMERPAYSNIAFTIFVMALERVTGKNYTQMVDEVLSKPLGMESTFPSPGDDKKAVIPPGESSWGADYGDNAPGGGLVSTISDLSKFSHAMLGRSLDLNRTQIRQWLKPIAWTGAYSAVGLPWEIFRPLHLTPNHPHPVAIYAKSGGAALYSSQLSIIDEYGLGLIMLSAGNQGASNVLSDALLATFVPAADEEARAQAEKNYARTFKSPCAGQQQQQQQNRTLEATFKLDNDSLIVSAISDSGNDVLSGLRSLWGLTMGQYTAGLGPTIRLFPTDLSEMVAVNGESLAKEVWRLWPEFEDGLESDLPGSKLGYDNCQQWTLGDWVHYGKEPLDRVLFYRDGGGRVVGFEMPSLRSGLLRPV